MGARGGGAVVDDAVVGGAVVGDAVVGGAVVGDTEVGETVVAGPCATVGLMATLVAPEHAAAKDTTANKYHARPIARSLSLLRNTP